MSDAFQNRQLPKDKCVSSLSHLEVLDLCPAPSQVLELQRVPPRQLVLQHVQLQLLLLREFHERFIKVFSASSIWNCMPNNGGIYGFS